MFDVRAGHRNTLGLDADLLCYGDSRGRVVARQHHNPNASTLESLHCTPSFRPRRVLKSNQADEHQVLLRALHAHGGSIRFGQPPLREGENAKAPRRHRTSLSENPIASIAVKSGLVAAHAHRRADRQDRLWRSLARYDAAASSAAHDDRHALAVVGERIFLDNG